MGSCSVQAMDWEAISRLNDCWKCYACCVVRPLPRDLAVLDSREGAAATAALAVADAFGDNGGDAERKMRLCMLRKVF